MGFTHVIFALCSFALCQTGQAVSPPPDGGYPNYTAAEGQNALLHLTTGVGNTAVGWSSLESVTTGNLNTAVGAATLFLNTADGNTAVGTAALLSNTTGINTATGTFALGSNSTGSNNTALGYHALAANTIGNLNTAAGDGALAANTQGSSNSAFGRFALISNVVGSSNTAVGDGALFVNQGGNENVAVGRLALRNSTSNNNTAIGNGAGFNITGNNNICIGFGVTGEAGIDNQIRIGDNVTGGYCFIGNIWNVGPGVPNTPVLVSDTGRLGVNTSSRRFKRDITAMGESSEAILALKPVTFHYKDDAKNTPCFGLIAEEVAEVNPDLILRDKEGKPFTVRYEQINAMLLNEFLKEHSKVEGQQATIAELKQTVAQQQKRFADQEKQIAALTSGLQKVRAHIEMNSPRPNVVSRNP